MKKDNTSVRAYRPGAYILVVIAIAAFFLCALFFNVSKDGFTLNGSDNLSVDSVIWKLEIIPLTALVIGFVCLIRCSRRLYRFRRQMRIVSGSDHRSSVLQLPKSVFVPFIGSWMLVLWALGWFIYTIALWSNPQMNLNVAEILGYSAMSSIDLFVFDINGNILDGITGYGGVNLHFVKGALIVVSVFCALCTFSLVINLFLSRWISNIHARFVKVRKTENNHIYIFWGTGKKERTLAASIAQNDPRHLIVFIEPDKSETDLNDGLNNVISYFSSTNPLAAETSHDRHSMFLVSDNAPSDIDPAVLWTSPGLERVAKLFARIADNRPEVTAADLEKGISPDNEIHIFLIGDNRDKNVSETKIIIEALNSVSNKNERFKKIRKTVYCQTRKDAVTGIIEDSRTNLDLGVEVAIIDESHLSINLLKENVDLQPVSFVDIETDDEKTVGAVKSPFNALIVGFGETGRDTLKFLYEFGAFLDFKDGKSSRSEFHAFAVDAAMDSIAPNFLAANPAVDCSDSGLVSFFRMTDNDVEFHRLVDRIANRLNYIVVSVGDDEANITIAVKILKAVRRRRDNLKNLKILVRAYGRESFSHLNGVAAHYNNILREESGVDSLIQIFGQMEEIFRYETIVANKFKMMAVKYNKSYSDAYHLTEEGSQYPVEYWDSRRKAVLKKARCAQLDDLHRKELQDFSNAWHSLTKVRIINEVLSRHCGDVSVADLAESMFEAPDNVPQREISPVAVSYPALDKLFGAPKFRNLISGLLTNLAITEHLRWTASHEMLGYTYGPKDHVRKTHNCMVAWEDLPEMPASSLRLYDYLVVETTISLQRASSAHREE